MRADLVAALAIEAEALACLSAILVLGRDDLDQALEPAEMGRTARAQVQQNLFVHDGFSDMIDDDRRDRRQPMMRSAMRQKADGWNHPQQFIELLGAWRI